MQFRMEFIIPVAFSLIMCACNPSVSVAIDLPTEGPSRTPNPTFTPTETPSLTPTASPTFAPSPTATPFGGSQAALMGIQICSEQYWKPCRYEGSVRVDFRTGSASLLWDGKYNAEAFSPDGQSLLLSQGTNLYVSDMTAEDPHLISINFLKGRSISAVWPKSDLIVFIGNRESETYIYTVKPDGTGLKAITHWRRTPFEIVPVSNSNGVLWEEGWWEPKGRVSGGYYWTDFTTMTTTALGHSGHFSQSPTGTQIAYESRPEEQDASGVWMPVSYLMILDLQTMESRVIPLPDLGELSSITNLVWLPDGDHLLVGRNCTSSEHLGQNISSTKRVFSVPIYPGV